MNNSVPFTGRPAEYSEEEIVAAGKKLQEENRNITGFALRQKVGGGNPNRLKQVWDEHVASQSIAQAEPVADLPIEVAEEMEHVTKTLTDRLSLLARELNDRAVKAAERRVAEVVRAAGDQREQAERELADASQTVDELEAMLDKERARAVELENRLANLQSTNQTQAVDLATLRERLELTERNAKAAANQHLAEMEQAQTALLEQKQSQQNLVAERDQLRTELAALKAKSDAAEESHKEQRKRSADEIQCASDKLIKIESERDNANKETSKAREEAAKLAGQLEAMQTQLAQLMEIISSHQSVQAVGTEKSGKE